MEAYDIWGIPRSLVALAIAMEHDDLASPIIKSMSSGRSCKRRADCCLKYGIALQRLGLL